MIERKDDGALRIAFNGDRDALTVEAWERDFGATQKDTVIIHIHGQHWSGHVYLTPGEARSLITALQEKIAECPAPKVEGVVRESIGRGGKVTITQPAEALCSEMLRLEGLRYPGHAYGTSVEAPVQQGDFWVGALNWYSAD